QMEQLLFYQNGAGCQYCHGRPASTPPGGLPQFNYASVNEHYIVGREYVGWPPFDNFSTSKHWLPHARFHHEAHRMLDCTACHKNARNSSLTSDLLLPHMSDCKQCHNRETGVRFDCATCHTYHNIGVNRSFKGKLEIRNPKSETMSKSEWTKSKI